MNVDKAETTTQTELREDTAQDKRQVVENKVFFIETLNN